MRFLVVSDRQLSTFALVSALKNIPGAVIVAEVNDLGTARDYHAKGEIDAIVADATVLEDSWTVAGVWPGMPWWVPAERLDGLSTRELEVLHLLGEGLSNRQIARTLKVKERTAKGHVVNILRKLGLESRLQAGLIALMRLSARTEVPEPGHTTTAAKTDYAWAPRGWTGRSHGTG